MKCRPIVFLLVVIMTTPPNLLANTCDLPPGPNTHFTPLIDFGLGEKYLNTYAGHLYDGQDSTPLSHDGPGRSRAGMIQKLDINGNPSPNGKIVFLSIGFSNNTIEFCGGNTFFGNQNAKDEPGATSCPTPVPLVPPTIPNCTYQDPGCPYNQLESFMGKAFNDSQVDRSGKIVLIDGAKGGQVLTCWDTTLPQDPGPLNCDQAPDNWGRVKNIIEVDAHGSEKQVQAVWLKAANNTFLLPPSLKDRGMPGVTDSDIDAIRAEIHLGNIVRLIKQHYPNVRQVFISPRIFGGYANNAGSNEPLNPEPYAYEIGFSVKWLVRAQIRQVEQQGGVDQFAGNLDYSSPFGIYSSIAPWIDWGPYLWANGDSQRSDGLQWLNNDFRFHTGDPNDTHEECTHPSTSGEDKVSTMLMNFMKNSPYTSIWFLHP